MDTAEQTLSDCLSEGAAGFSTGLMYSPGCERAPRKSWRDCAK